MVQETDKPPQLLRGETTLYGHLLCIGGTKPFFVLRLDNGVNFPCECTIEFVKNLARSNKLYEVIGVSGTAQWQPETLELVKFRAEELLPYEDTSIVAAFDELRQASNGAFDGIDDVEAFVRSIRYGEDIEEEFQKA